MKPQFFYQAQNPQEAKKVRSIILDDFERNIAQQIAIIKMNPSNAQSCIDTIQEYGHELRNQFRRGYI